jgi:hypothetical protein
MSHKRQRGNTIVEFALVSIFLVPLLLGTINVGMNLTRAVQVNQVSRDAGHMFARFVDFSLENNQNIIVRLAYGLGMELTSGNGRVTLTRVMQIGDIECEAGGFQVADCTNHGLPVITQQIVVGNNAKRSSDLGEPPPYMLDSQGEVSAADYLTDVRTRAAGFDQILTLGAGEMAYVSEAYFEAPEFDFPGFMENTSVYARTIF